MSGTHHSWYVTGSRIHLRSLFFSLGCAKTLHFAVRILTTAHLVRSFSFKKIRGNNFRSVLLWWAPFCVGSVVLLWLHFHSSQSNTGNPHSANEGHKHEEWEERGLLPGRCRKFCGLLLHFTLCTHFCKHCFYKVKLRWTCMKGLAGLSVCLGGGGGA